MEFGNVIATRESSELHAEFFKKSHELVFSQLSLSPIEHDMFALFLTRLAKEHWQDYERDQRIDQVPRYEFSSDVLSEWFGVDKKYLHSTLFKPADRLSSRKIGMISKDNKSFDFIPLFKRISYKEGLLTVVPNDELIKEYLSLGRGHSQIPHNQFRNIPIEHGKRLFTMLCRFKQYGELHPQSIQALHGFFGLLDQKGSLTKKGYAKTSAFITRIIKPAIDAVSKNAPDIEFLIDEKSGNFGFRPVKQGRTIVAIEFLYRWTRGLSDHGDIDVELNLDDAIRSYCDISSNSNVPLEREIKNLKNHMAQLVDEGFMFDADFIEKMKCCERINASGHR